MLASETGGRAIFDANDLRPDLARIQQDLGSYYSLGYSPPHLGDGLYGREDNPLEIGVELGAATPGAGGNYTLPVRLRIPLFKIAFQDRQTEIVARLRLFVATTGGISGEASRIRQVEVPIRVPREKTLIAMGAVLPVRGDDDAAGRRAEGGGHCPRRGLRADVVPGADRPAGGEGGAVGRTEAG